eukprot:870246_1
MIYQLRLLSIPGWFVMVYLFGESIILAEGKVVSVVMHQGVQHAGASIAYGDTLNLSVIPSTGLESGFSHDIMRSDTMLGFLSCDLMDGFTLFFTSQQQSAMLELTPTFVSYHNLLIACTKRA